MPGPGDRFPGWPPRPAGARRRRRGRAVLVFLVVAALGIVALTAGGLWWASEHYTDRVERLPNVFPHHNDRPDKQGDDGALNFLVAGIDSRSDLPTTGKNSKADLWKPGAQRSDTLMLLHLAADRHKAYVVSIPRDTWVPIPGHGDAKVNASFSLGGPPLLIDTVEKLTGIRIDHFAVIDWDGFKSLTDSVGGVTLTVPQDTYDTEQHRGWKAGTYTMNGEEALDYVRQRHGLPRSDFDRIARQQNFLRTLMSKMRGDISFTNPGGVIDVLDAFTDAVSVDDQLSNSELRTLAFDLRDLKTRNVTFMTAPISRSDFIKGQSVVIMDRAKSKSLWPAIVQDRLPDWIRQHGDADVLGSTVR